MHYYQCLIYAHRPWMSRTFIQPQPPQGPGPAHDRKMCIDAAISIAKLLQAYESRYTFRRMNIQGPAITCSAALLLIFASISHIGRSQGLNVAPHLSVCFRALDEFGQSWESAKRAKDFLTRLQRQWELKARSRRSNSSRKRPLTSTGFDSDQDGLHSTWQLPPQRPIQDTQKQQGQAQGSDDGLGMDFDMDYDWMLEANVQAAFGDWASIPSSRPLPSELMGFLPEL